MNQETDLNLFLALDLDPDAVWNQSEFETRVVEKRQKWAKLANSPSAAGDEANRKRMAIPNFRKIAADEIARNRHAAEAKVLRQEATAEMLKNLKGDLRLHQAKGYILEAELNGLIEKYSGAISEQDIKKRIKVPVKKREETTQPTQAALDATVANKIQQFLTVLGKTTLYDFLDMDSNTDLGLLQKRAQDVYRNTKTNVNRTDEVKKTSILAGHGMLIFKTPGDQARYDETLRLQRFDGLKSDIDLVASISKEISAGQVEELLRNARVQGLDTKEAVDTIQEHAKRRKYGLVLPETVFTAVVELQQCGYCSFLNDKNNKHCQNCGKTVKEECPKCKTSVHSADKACHNCGFKLGNRGWVNFLIIEAQDTFNQREFSIALDRIEEAGQSWPATSKNPLSLEINALEQKIRPAKERQDKFRQQMQQEVNKKRYYAARALLPDIEKNLPLRSAELITYKQQINESIEKCEAKVSQARQAFQSRTDSDRAALLCQEALRICADSQDARDLLAKSPPEPPSDLRAVPGDKIINLRWKPSKSPHISYAIVRKKHSRPVSVTDGEKLSTTMGTIYDDTNAEPGVPLFYAIFTDREGVSSKTSATLAKPVMLIEEACNIIVQIENKQVQLSWQSPPNVYDIKVARSSHKSPQSINDGKLIPVVGSNQAVDNGVVNDQRYFYSIFCRFKTYEGDVLVTKGSHVEAIPQEPPTPIENLDLTVDGPAHNRQITLRWSTPTKGDVIILKTDKPSGLEAGSKLPRRDLNKFGELITPHSNHLTDSINKFGFYYYVPIIIFHEIAYIGREKEYVSVDDVTELAVQNLGHALRLQWQWPQNCTEAIVAYSYEGWPDLESEMTIKNPLMRAQYEISGFFDIVHPTVVDHYITVFAVVSQAGQTIVSSGKNQEARKVVRLHSRLSLNYEIKKVRFSKKQRLRLQVKGKGTLPSLILMGKVNSLPMNKNDGSIVMQIPSQAVNNTQIELDLPEGSRRPRSFARLFLEDDGQIDMMKIYQPARDRLRLD